MPINTAAAAISFAGSLEEATALFYEQTAQRYGEEAAYFLSLAKANRRNKAQVERTYYGIISDAIEGCFAFEMDPEDYPLQTEPPEDRDLAAAVDRAVDNEDKIIAFYTEAARQAKDLLADVPRLFETIARKRRQRRVELEALRVKRG